MIKIENLTKIYHLYNNPKDRLKESLSISGKKYHQEFFALNDVDITINESDIVGIIGNNGSGKSTLLKLITGVLTPTNGTVNVDGKITALLELGAGFNPELSGMQNIYLHGSLSGFTKSQMDKKIDDIVEFAEIGEFIHQAIKTYSSGMKSRLAFALSIHVDPEVFIIDEVLSVGDAAFQRKCFAKIESFKEQGKTILFVSHSIGHIVELCHRAIWLDKGRKVIEGDTKIVTGLYQKYGNKKDLNHEEVREEFESKFINTTEPKKEKIVKNLINQELKSKSLISYEENGAKISDVRVLNLDFEETNILENGSEYYYSYNVEFDEDYDDVNLAMLLKTKIGLEIGGKEVSLIKQNTLNEIKKNTLYGIKWKFKNILNEGTYFFNCGVNTIIDEEKVVLHRILDAYMFEVLPDNDNLANKIVDFGFEFTLKEQ